MVCVMVSIGGQQVYAEAQRCFMGDHMLYLAVVNLLSESALKGLKASLSVSGVSVVL